MSSAKYAAHMGCASQLDPPVGPILVPKIGAHGSCEVTRNFRRAALSVTRNK